MAPVTLAVHSHQLLCASCALVLPIQRRGEKWHLGGCGQGGLGADGVSSNAHVGFSRPFRISQEKSNSENLFHLKTLSIGGRAANSKDMVSNEVEERVHHMWDC